MIIISQHSDSSLHFTSVSLTVLQPNVLDPFAMSERQGIPGTGSDTNQLTSPQFGKTYKK